jgi:hypothetical protein
LGTFSSGVVKPGFMIADVMHEERKADLPLIPSLVKRGKK